jgi:hypothetical protein
MNTDNKKERYIGTVKLNQDTTVQDIKATVNAYYDYAGYYSVKPGYRIENTALRYFTDDLRLKNIEPRYLDKSDYVTRLNLDDDLDLRTWKIIIRYQLHDTLCSLLFKDDLTDDDRGMIFKLYATIKDYEREESRTAERKNIQYNLKHGVTRFTYRELITGILNKLKFNLISKYSSPVNRFKRALSFK